MANQNQNLYPRGSEWRKWDLQIHCPEDVFQSSQFEGKDLTEKWDKYLSALEQTDLEVIAITNYFCIKGYQEILKRKNQGRIGNIKLILPNIEFRISQPNKNGEFINLHVIFSDKVVPEKIQQFLDSLPQISTTSDQKILYCSEEHLQKVSYGRALVDFKVLKKHLDDNFKHLENYLIFGVPRGYGSSRPLGNEGRGVTVAVEIDKIADAFFGNAADIQHFLNVQRYEEARPKPVVATSDAHELIRIGANFSWIKADPTFEGLKQILYEPELRIKIQQENPRENEIYTRIEKCAVKFPSSLKIQTEEFGKKTDFCLQGEYEFEFSNNLTCIIGGRGSGKSTLIHLLHNAWNKKEIGKLDHINSPLISLDLPPDSLKQVENITRTEVPEDTEFFLQNEIEKFARDVDEMSKLIRHRLMRLSSLDGKQPLKDLQSNWSSTSRSMAELINAYDYIADTNRKIETLRKQIDTLKKQTAVIKSKEYKDFQKEIEEINDKISVFKRYKNEYSSLIKEIDALSTNISHFGWDQEHGSEILEELTKLLKDYREKLAHKFSEIERKYEVNKYTEQLASKKLQLKKYLEKKGLSPENIEELADASGQIKELEDEIQSLEREMVSYENTYRKRDEILRDYKKNYDAYRDRFFEVAERLEKELKGLPFFDKEISFTPKINIQALQEAAVEFVKKNSPAKIILRADDIQSVLFDVKDVADYLSDKDKIKTCVNKSEKTILHKQVLQELVNDSVFLERLYLGMWKDYFDTGNIQVQTKLGDKFLQNTSFGERCGIVISIVLVAGTNPIIIDQPEDNLDGKFISNVLVPLIRKRKYNRQVILVTRDANIAIGGDAELIHILESDERKTEIIPSSIENIEHREKYIWILDGGKEAFENREKKYGFRYY